MPTRSLPRPFLALPLLAGAGVSQGGPLPSGPDVSQGLDLLRAERALVHDVATGVDTWFDAPALDLAASHGLAPGLAPSLEPAALPELYGDAWASDLSPIDGQGFPWSAQCRIFMDKVTGPKVGSGTLVGPRHVITAGHVVWDEDAGTWATNVRVVPAWDGDDGAYGDAQAARLASFTGWTQNGNSDHDMGMIELDRPLGFLTGTFGYAWDANDSYYTSTSFHRAGYPGGSTCYAGAPNQLYYSAGIFDSVTPYQLVADLYWSCVAGGMSGSGVYAFAGNERYVHAISRATGDTSSVPMTKYDTRMTQGKFDFFDGTFVPDGYPDAQMDLLPLAVEVDTGGEPVGAGEALPSLQYVVANASLHSDAIQSTVFADVYLSEDDTVTTADLEIGSHAFTEHFSALESITIVPSVLPTLPADLPSGTYWVGVHVKKTDADPGNDVATGWDAAEIEVNARWPHLPAAFKPVGDGLYASFDQAPWLSDSIAFNALDSHTREDDPDAWCNAGQHAAPIAPFSGSQNLEMGLAPGAAPELVSNGLVMAFDGQGHDELELDFMVRDHGEESHPDDGIFVSEDGLSWEPVHGDWTPLGPNWTNVVGIDLSSTPVDVGGEFYLLFAQQDDTAFGVVDGVSIDDVRVHPPAPALAVTGLAAGELAQVELQGGTPGGTAVLVFSVTGGGPTPSPLGPVMVSGSVAIVPGLPLDAGGALAFESYVDPQLAGMPFWFQALDLASSVWSNGVATQVQ